MKKENYNMKTKPVKRCREDVIFDTVILRAFQVLCKQKKLM